MAIIYRTDGAWGSGKGANLAPAEVDGNFHDIDTRVTSIEDNPVEPIVPTAINIEGSAFTMGLSNGETLGPITLTMPMPTWRGAWNATVAYAELDFFTSPDNGLGAVMIPHTSAATFDWGALDPGGTGLPVYRQLIGGSGTTSGVADLVDVALGTQTDNDMLVWDAPASLWRNETPAAVNVILPAFGGSTGSVAGLKGLVPAPAAGDATAGKVLGAGGGWIVPAGGSGGSSSLAGLADVAIVSPLNLSLLQYSSVDGKWHNQTLATLGAGTVTHIDTGAGLVGGPITSTGSIAIAPIATLAIMANVTGSSTAPAGVSLSTLLDAVLGTGRGSVLYRGGTGWLALTPGIDGQFLRTGGPSADVTWGNPAGSGTVTQVNSGAGLTGGPITATGTLSLAPVSDSQVLANISGGVAAPAGTTLTLLLDHALGATQGMIVYRGAASWSALAPGASGAVLTSGGAAANPSWVTGSGAGTVTNVATGTGLIGGPITGTGTISFATVGNQTLLANISGATAAPTPSTMSAIMDAVFASARGSVIYRGAAGWAALAPGTAGQVLTTAGAAADPAWAAAAGGASVTIGDTAPGSPTAGSLWWDSVGGQGYISFNDTTSTQWVPFSNQPGANISGMTAGQIPIAATATTVTSSAALSGDVTSNATLVTTLATVNANVGTWNNVTINAKGLATAGSTVAYLTAVPAYTGDVTSAAGGTVNTLATVNANVGTFAVSTVNAKGLVTAAANMTGDITTAAGVSTLATVNGNVGTFAATTVNAKGLVTAAAALTGDVTTVGGAATIANNAVTTAKILAANVTYAKIQNVAANRLLGNATGSAAAPAEIALPLVVANGGTGTASLPAGANTNAAFGMTRGLLMGAGTGAVTADPSWGGYTPADGGLVGAMASATANPYIEFSRSLGTPGTPAAVANGTILGVIQWDGYDTAWQYAKAMIYGEATEAWTTTAHGARIRIQATPTGGNVTADQMTIQNGVIVGAPTGSFKGVGTLNATGVYGAGTILTSDASLKRDIGELPACLPLVAAIEPKSYRWREPEDIATVPPGWADQTHWGFLAQDVERALTGHDVGVVDVGEDGIRGLSLGDMNAVLWQAVRELADEVAALKSALAPPRRGE